MGGGAVVAAVGDGVAVRLVVDDEAKAAVAGDDVVAHRTGGIGRRVDGPGVDRGGVDVGGVDLGTTVGDRAVDHRIGVAIAAAFAAGLEGARGQHQGRNRDCEPRHHSQPGYRATRASGGRNQGEVALPVEGGGLTTAPTPTTAGSKVLRRTMPAPPPPPPVPSTRPLPGVAPAGAATDAAETTAAVGATAAGAGAAAGTGGGAATVLTAAGSPAAAAAPTVGGDLGAARNRDRRGLEQEGATGAAAAAAVVVVRASPAGTAGVEVGGRCQLDRGLRHDLDAPPPPPPALPPRTPTSS